MNEIDLLRKLAESAANQPPSVDVVARVEASIAAAPAQPIALWAACAGISTVAAAVALTLAALEWAAWPVSEFFEQISAVIT